MLRYLLPLLLFIASFQTASAEDFYYKKYDVTAHVHADNSYSISEKMDAFFNAPCHGIVRDWNSHIYVKRQLLDEDGKKVEKIMEYSPDFEDVNVSEQFETSHDDGFSVKIGNGDKYVSDDHHYQIDYNYVVGNDRVSTGDLYYFSLLGSGNATDVKEFTFAIHFDKKIPAAYLKQLKLFYGEELDSTNKAKQYLTLVSDSIITGTVKNLAPNEAVTVYLPLPEGYFNSEKVDIKDEESTFWYFWGVTIILAALVLIRETKSRNNFTTVIEYWPPKNLSSADLGYIYDQLVDTSDIVSLIPYFAHKGYLTIDTTQGHPILFKVKDIDEAAPQYQKTLFEAFFKDADYFDTESPSNDFAEKWLDVEKEIKDANKGIQDHYAWGHIIMSAIAGLSLAGGMIVCDFTECGTLGVIGVLVALGLGVIAGSILTFWDYTAYSKNKRYCLIIFCIIVGILTAGTLSFIDGNEEIFITSNMEMAIYTAVALLAIVAIFMMRLGNMTKERLDKIGHILGLKEFIEKSEKPLLDSLLKQDEQYFYDILPYAVAFGLSEKWAKQFEGLNVKPASWYNGGDNTTMGLCGFMTTNHLYSNAMKHSVNELKDSRASASSGSSGGFSGGGFGGGGSHSW